MSFSIGFYQIKILKEILFLLLKFTRIHILAFLPLPRKYKRIKDRGQQIEEYYPLRNVKNKTWKIS
tara:strand:- start:82260 stop:82457 length:198 start_codon:yes stop_codon:yes gene_type:complete